MEVSKGDMFWHIMNQVQCKAMLYIGVGLEPEKTFLDEILSKNYEVVILEISDLYINQSKDYLSKYNNVKIIQGDVKDIDILFESDSFDAVVWSHGPEHINRNEVDDTLRKCCFIARKLVFVNCPFGIYPQTIVVGNIYESHLCSLYPEDFVSIGFNSKSFGQKDKPFDGGSVISYVLGDDLQKIKAQKF